jgi:hypothetical protein
MGNANKKLDFFFVVLIVLVIGGLPLGISFYDRYTASKNIPADAKHFTLTGHSERGWIIGDGRAGLWCRVILESKRRPNRKAGH